MTNPSSFFGGTGRGERITKTSVTFLVLVRGKIFLYHPKVYIYGFILKNNPKLFFAPFMVKKRRRKKEEKKEREKRRKR